MEKERKKERKKEREKEIDHLVDRITYTVDNNIYKNGVWERRLWLTGPLLSN